MKITKIRQGFLAITVMAILLAVAVPGTALGQNRSRSRHNNGDWSNRNWTKHNKKCGKFVNCHDARDGRRDNRGPRGDRVGNNVSRYRFRQRNRNVIQNRNYVRYQNRYRRTNN